MLKLQANGSARVIREAIATAGCVVLLLTTTSCAVTQARMYDNETGAIGEIRTIQTAQTKYSSQFGRWAGSLQELGTARMIDAQLSSGTKTGYRYQLTQVKNGYTIQATPNAFNTTGSRSFYSDQTGVIHEHHGPDSANAGDPAIPLK